MLFWVFVSLMALNVVGGIVSNAHVWVIEYWDKRTDKNIFLRSSALPWIARVSSFIRAWYVGYYRNGSDYGCNTRLWNEAELMGHGKNSWLSFRRCYERNALFFLIYTIVLMVGLHFSLVGF